MAKCVVFSPIELVKDPFNKDPFKYLKDPTGTSGASHDHTTVDVEFYIFKTVKS